MEKIVLITGATAGIGLACAEKFASHQHPLIITGRRLDRLESISRSLQEKYQIPVLPLCFDVRDKESVNKQLKNLPAEWKQVDILINNAGLALGRDSFDRADMDDWETMIETNINGLLYVSRAIIDGMTERRSGHIINLGSVAGKQVYENGNVYCASKAAVDAISQSMRIDLLKYGIKVTAIHPGAVETEFSLVRFKGDEQKARSAYIGYKPLVADDVANTIYYCCTLPAHVCINDLVITCTRQADAIYFHKDPH